MDEFSVALASPLHRELQAHLLRLDRQEDLAFVVWRPSVGAMRETAIIDRVVMPRDDDRFVHGNVAFSAAYFLRACAVAAEVGGGVGLIHSHPGGRRWQGLSSDDHAAESQHAAQAVALTGLPIVGLTMAGDSTYSARVWRREAARHWSPTWARNVRVVGDQMRVSQPDAHDQISRVRQRRTIDSWGIDVQRTIASLRVAVVGAGSVGSQVVEALARTGFGEVLVLDFDAVESHNLDRILNATNIDARRGRLKAELAASSAQKHATHPSFVARWSDRSAVEHEGIELLKDCDLIFSCVDRPAGRSTLNALAYGHLIPVVDGGVLVDSGQVRMRGAEWRAHVAAPGRRCLECLGQYDPALVQADREGLFDDPSYLTQLPAGSLLSRNENVFAFSAAAAAGQVLAALRMIVAPAGVADIGAELTHFATGTTELDLRDCEAGCPYDAMVAAARDDAPIAYRHVPAELARRHRLGATRTNAVARNFGALLARVRRHR